MEKCITKVRPLNAVQATGSILIGLEKMQDVSKNAGSKDAVCENQ